MCDKAHARSRTRSRIKLICDILVLIAAIIIIYQLFSGDEEEPEQTQSPIISWHNAYESWNANTNDYNTKHQIYPPNVIPGQFLFDSKQIHPGQYYIRLYEISPVKPAPKLVPTRPLVPVPQPPKPKPRKPRGPIMYAMY
jgi:hypothetical protein